jgi:deoxyadenosine/deoxycytidine kinase
MVKLSINSDFSVLESPRVELLGLFGAGKTTLARSLLNFNQVSLFEDHNRVHMWGNNSLNKKIGFLPYDVAFLLHHFEISTMNTTDGVTGLAICDWSFSSDLLWASLRLGSDFNTYQTLHSKLTSRVSKPLGYIYLRYPVELVHSRICKRARLPESGLAITELTHASEKLEILVKSLDPACLLIVDPNSKSVDISARILKWIEA